MFGASIRGRRKVAGDDKGKQTGPRHTTQSRTFNDGRLGAISAPSRKRVGTLAFLSVRPASRRKDQGRLANEHLEARSGRRDQSPLRALRDPKMK